jgi:hypothetical protein
MASSSVYLWSRSNGHMCFLLDSLDSARSHRRPLNRTGRRFHLLHCGCQYHACYQCLSSFCLRWHLKHLRDECLIRYTSRLQNHEQWCICFQHWQQWHHIQKLNALGYFQKRSPSLIQILPSENPHRIPRE